MVPEVLVTPEQTAQKSGGDLSSVEPLCKWLRRICSFSASLHGNDLVLHMPKGIARELNLRERLVRVHINGSIELFHEPIEGDSCRLLTLPISEL